jgi:DNA-binding XRE family transcriptional regulator
MYKIGMRFWTPERIKTLRSKFQLSQVALGRLVGVAGNYIYMLEKGERRPSKTLCLLLNRLEVELQEQNIKKEGGKHGQDKGNLQTW